VVAQLRGSAPEPEHCVDNQVNFWVDRSGHSCAETNCKLGYGVNGVSAKKACCRCGGGDDQTPCTDLSSGVWADAMGYTCHMYTEFDFCNPNKTTAAGWVSDWGSIADNADQNKMDAFKSCCGCGGGDMVPGELPGPPVGPLYLPLPAPKHHKAAPPPNYHPGKLLPHTSAKRTKVTPPQLAHSTDCDEGCALCDEEKVCAKCEDGHFPHRGKCRACVEGCMTCSSETVCMFCKRGLFVYQGDCVKWCPSGTKSVNNVCTATNKRSKRAVNGQGA